MMDSDQTLKELRKELSVNDRLVELLREDSKNFADEHYRRTKDVIDHAGLLRLTGVAAGVEVYAARLLERLGERQ